MLSTARLHSGASCRLGTTLPAIRSIKTVRNTLKRTTTVRLASMVLTGLLGIGVAGCTTSADTKPVDSSSAEVADEAPPKAVDLDGDWTQTNSKSKDNYQAATIADDTIEVKWVADGGDTTSLFWAGSVETPGTGEATFKWESTNDTSKTESSILASSEPTKTFTYDKGVISYEVSALGIPTIVKLEKK